MRVFVSSTCHDLIDVRAEVEAHIRDMGLTPILSDSPGSEFTVPPDVNSIEACLANVRSSDAVICILSQRYGPLLGGAGFEDVSATHLEWREARNAKKPIRMYVRDRLEAEYAHWKRNPSAKFVWAKEPGLFSLLDEHRTLIAATDASNWVWTFRDSVDLKARLDIDFKAISSRVILERWLRDGRLPVLRAVLAAQGGDGRVGTIARYALRFYVLGDASALDASVHVEGQENPLNDLMPGVSKDIGVNETIPESGIVEIQFVVRYTTSFGAVIEDAFELRHETTKPDIATIRHKQKKLVGEIAFELA